jgi:hypothetical protein
MILEFFAGTDHGVKVKTKRRKNSARHDKHEGRIKIWSYHKQVVIREPGRGCASEFLKLFRHPAALPLVGLLEIIVGQVLFFRQVAYTEK